MFEYCDDEKLDELEEELYSEKMQKIILVI